MLQGGLGAGQVQGVRKVRRFRGLAQARCKVQDSGVVWRRQGLRFKEGFAWRDIIRGY